MPDWALFAAVTVVVSLAFVALARASARAVAGEPGGEPTPLARRLGSDGFVARNVVASHGLLLVVLAATVWAARVPAPALGLGVPTAAELAVGAGLGLALAVGNEGTVRVAGRIGLEPDERLRRLLAPDAAVGWARLLLVVLPLVALAEELLFRGAIVGGLAAGSGLPVLGLAVGSSVLFGLGHGLQGRLGIAVTTGLGAGLAAAFVLTGSLAVVVVAHYVVNAVEFVVNEGLGSER